MSSSFTTACCDIEFYGRELYCRVLWPRVVILSLMAAGYIVKLYDRVLWFSVWWPLAMLSILTTACCDIEIYYRELFHRLLQPRGMILSFIAASYDVEFYNSVLGCWVSWPRDVMSRELASWQNVLWCCIYRKFKNISHIIWLLLISRQIFITKIGKHYRDISESYRKTAWY